MSARMYRPKLVVTHKVCSSCGKEKPVALFPSGRRCSECKNKAAQERKQAARGLKPRGYTRIVE